MGNPRKIRKIMVARPTLEGAGVHLRRAIGFDQPESYDPFLLLDDFRSDEPAEYANGFPWHPHRGIETVTYVLAGKVEHQDSMGNKGVIGPGDLQWMTAGSGIYHQEMPMGDNAGRMHGFQLWANLPRGSKMGKPGYRGILASDIPEARKENGVTIKVIAGSSGDVTGPVREVAIQPEYFDIAIPPETGYVHPTVPGFTAFIYVIEGEGFVANGESWIHVENRNLVLFSDGDSISLRAAATGLRFLFISGKPLNEPIAWYGPIVMNTDEEIRTAYEELEMGTFVKN